MPAIQNLASGGAPAPYRFSPLNLGQEPPAALPPDLRGAAAKQGQAALMGTVAETLSKLPQVLASNYVDGRKIAMQGVKDDLLTKAASGETLTDGQLAALTGNFKRPEPLEAEKAAAELAYKKAQIKALETKTTTNPGGLVDNPLISGYADENDAPPAKTGGASTEAGLIPEANPLSANEVVPSTGGDPTIADPVNPPLPVKAPVVSMRAGALASDPLDNPIPPSTVPNSQMNWPRATLADAEPTVQMPVSTNPNPPAPAAASVAAPVPMGALSDDAEAMAGPVVGGFLGAPAGVLEDAAAPPATPPGVTLVSQNVTPDGAATAAARDNAGLPAVADDAGTPTPEAMANAKGGKFVTDSGPAGGKLESFPGYLRETTEDGTVIMYPKKVKPGQKGFTVMKKPTGVQVPATIKAEAMRMGVWKDGMSGTEVAKAMEDKTIETGEIPPHLMPAAENLAQKIVSHPALKHLPTIREAYGVVMDGLANPEAGGFSDMALIEGFQRMVNPGATVRTQTMTSMKEAAGWLQQLDPTYQWNKATQGDKFTPEARERLKNLSEDIFKRAMSNAAPQLKGMAAFVKGFGIKSPEKFVDNVMTIAPLFDNSQPESSPVTPGATNPVATQAPATPTPAVPRGGVPGSVSNPHAVGSQEDYAKVRGGEYYRDSSGQLKQKPIKKGASIAVGVSG